MEVLLLSILFLVGAYLAFVAFTVILAKFFFTKIETDEPERSIFEYAARLKPVRKKVIL